MYKHNNNTKINASVQWILNAYPHFTYVVDKGNPQHYNLWLSCR